MTFINALKEGFALAPIDDRHHVVDKLAAPNTANSYYYQGLVTLQKLHAQVMKVENPVAPRAPSQAERDLSNQLKEVMAKLKETPDYLRYEKLESRFNLLAYPFQTAATIEYMKNRLSISGQQQSVTLTDQENLPEAEKTPSVLDPSLIDGTKLIEKKLSEKNVNRYELEEMAFPNVGALWDNLDRETRLKLINSSKHQPSMQLFGSDLVKKLAELLNFQDKQKKDVLSMPNYNYFTLEQMDELLKLSPRVVYSDTTFVECYLYKLLPAVLKNNRVVFWDDHENALKDYLDRAESFASKLPEIYRQLKSTIKFHMLRNDIIRQDFSQDNLLR
jgi:hypothetical protein